MDFERRRSNILESFSSSSFLSKSRALNRYRKRRKSTDCNRIIKINPDKREINNKPYNIFENGINITPKSLTDSEYTSREGTISKPYQTSVPAQSKLAQLQSIDSMMTVKSGNLSLAVSRYSIGGSHRSLSATSFEDVNEISEISFKDDIELADQEALQITRAPSMFLLRKDPPPKVPKVETNFKLNLMETDTMFLLQLPSQSDSLETDNGKEILESNETYEKSIETIKAMSSIAVQTTKLFQKHRKLYKPRNERRNAGAFVSIWEMYDTYESIAMDKNGDDATMSTREEGRVDTIVVYDEHQEYNTTFDFCGYKFNKRFLNALMIVERIIIRNAYSESQLIYQGLMVQDPFSSNIKYNYSLTHLWTFHCKKAKKRTVTAMSWNLKNKNIMAVGYGKFKFSTKCDGLVCVWNVKNPGFPERLYEFPDDPVTFVSFSNLRWHILAVTFYSGLVILIDIVGRSVIVKANNSHYPLYYPVRQAHWFPPERKKTILITCSKGGKIFRYKKSEFFLSNKIMALGRSHGNIHGVEQPRKCFARKVLMSRQPAAEVLVQHPEDPQVYLIGSAEGYIYVCSVQHRHDYRDIFVAHNGPIYNIQFNPFCSKIFLTCGGDSCIRIWAESVTQPLITLESGLSAVQDAVWSQLHSTVIISLTGTFIELWDIRRRTSTPMSSSQTPTKAHNTLIKFSQNKFNICVGDVDGDVHVMALTEMPFSPTYQEAILVESVYAALITKPEICQILLKIGPPFVSVKQMNSYDRKDNLNKKLSTLFKNI